MKEKKPTNAERIKEKMERYDSGAVQSLFRTISRNHYNLLKMVDNKARIILTTNSIITSLLLGLLFISTDNQNEKLELGIRILIISSMFSMIFSLISMLPCLYFGKVFRNSGYKGTLYAQNFSKLSLDEFKNEFSRIMKIGRNTYDEMITDLYFLGRCISYKQKLLYLAAIIFLIGLITAISIILLSNGMIKI